SIRIPGTFQSTPWDWAHAPHMTRSEIAEGTLWTYTTPNELEAGFGVDTSRQVMLFHRWGPSDTGHLQRFYIVLNFSSQPQWVRVPFPANGPWTDLLANFAGSWTPTVSDFHLDVLVGSNWGNVFFRED